MRIPFHFICLIIHILYISLEVFISMPMIEDYRIQKNLLSNEIETIHNFTMYRVEYRERKPNAYVIILRNFCLFLSREYHSELNQSETESGREKRFHFIWKIHFSSHFFHFFCCHTEGDLIWASTPIIFRSIRTRARTRFVFKKCLLRPKPSRFTKVFMDLYLIQKIWFV